MSRQRTSRLIAGAVALVALAASATALSTGFGAAAAPTSTGAQATTAGCGKAPALRSGTHTIQSGGRNRTFILRVPDNYTNTRAYRLIFAFHWWHGTANDVASGGSSGAAWSYYG